MTVIYKTAARPQGHASNTFMRGDVIQRDYGRRGDVYMVGEIYKDGQYLRVAVCLGNGDVVPLDDLKYSYCKVNAHIVVKEEK